MVTREFSMLLLWNIERIGGPMYYLFLAAAVAFECGGTFCMKLSDGFSQLGPSIGCLALYGLCFAFFSKALQGIPLSVAYASWGALGIILATAISVFAFKEPLNAPMIAGIVMCVAGVLVVNIFSTH